MARRARKRGDAINSHCPAPFARYRILLLYRAVRIDLGRCISLAAKLLMRALIRFQPY